MNGNFFKFSNDIPGFFLDIETRLRTRRRHTELYKFIPTITT